MQNNGLNPEMMNNIKNLVDNGNISEAISKISPEMIENFSKIMSNSNSNKNDESTNNTSNNQNSNNSQNTYNSSKNSSSNNFDFNNIDMNTILTKQEKLDQYVNLLKVSQIAEVLKNDKKDDKNA